jgi:hypothetical protein
MIDPYFDTTTSKAAYEIRIVFSQEEYIASKLLMTNLHDWASSEIHSKLANIINDLCNQYVSLALENGWEVPSSKVDILKMARAHYCDSNTNIVD